MTATMTATASSLVAAPIQFAASSATIAATSGSGSGGGMEILAAPFMNESYYLDLINNITNFGANISSYNNGTNNGNNYYYTAPNLEIDVIIQIALYSVIFLLAVLGNVLVILTLVQNTGMRTITNLFLLNLSFSDLLVGVFCMPFTLVGIVLREFVFGAVLCKLIPYLQAVAVSVSAWTLVAISVERYYAICHPLTSRRWQTLSHAYKIIGVVWVGSLFCMSPIAILSSLMPTRYIGRYKCRETWPNKSLEQLYTVYLDIILLVLPLVIMTVKYSLITRTLWASANSGQTFSLPVNNATGDSTTTATPSASPSKPTTTDDCTNNSNNSSFRRNHFSFKSSLKRQVSNRLSVKTHYPPSSPSAASGGPATTTGSGGPNGNGNAAASSLHVHYNCSSPSYANTGGHGAILRHTNMAKSFRSKKRVIQMLFLIVIEFFVCWTPLYVVNTWSMFNPFHVYQIIGGHGISLIQLLAYLSSCSNPITYGFMNRGFRIAFCHVFGCHCGLRRQNSNSTTRIRNDSVRFARNRSVYNNSMALRPAASEDV